MKRLFVLVSLVTLLVAQAPTAQTSFPIEKPSPPLIPTFEECDRFDAQWQAVVAAASDAVNACLKATPFVPGSPLRSLGQCCIDYYGNPVPELCQGAECISQRTQWFCLANERKNAVANCKERAEFYKNARDFLKAEEDASKSEARHTQEEINRNLRNLPGLRTVFRDRLARRLWKRTMDAIAKSNDLTLREAEKLSSTVNNEPTGQQTPPPSQPTRPSPNQTQDSLTGLWDCNIVSSTYPGGVSRSIWFANDGTIRWNGESGDPVERPVISGSNISFEEGPSNDKKYFKLARTGSQLVGSYLYVNEPNRYSETVQVTCSRSAR